MDAKTKGAWLVHHTHKLEQMSGVQEFNNIYAAGKAAILLSALSASDQISLSLNKVEVLAKASNINTLFELPKLLELLQSRGLIQVSKKGVDVLGVTTTAVVQHASGVYEELGPSALENAALALSELASQSPLRQKESQTYLGDSFKLTSGQCAGLLEQVEEVGFVDFENLGGDKVYFNGNLFRREQIAKTQAVLNSLSVDDKKRVTEVDELLKKFGCVSLTEVTKVLGAKLLEKLNAIAMYDINVVNNDKENIAFVTRPAAFSKYGNPLVEDALDLTKAFVSSLTYGMTRSNYARGRITMIEKLMKALIAGRWVGPVEAIGQDYRALARPICVVDERRWSSHHIRGHLNALGSSHIRRGLSIGIRRRGGLLFYLCTRSSSAVRKARLPAHLGSTRFPSVWTENPSGVIMTVDGLYRIRSHRRMSGGVRKIIVTMLLIAMRI